ncbi:MAG: sigma-70 family RNA polymerase sigma factor [Acidobacterium ailaaui]|nr:sigma-70 family RNA polymerase sigma factor [Pseudacidobacterium ailaaui]
MKIANFEEAFQSFEKVLDATARKFSADFKEDYSEVRSLVNFEFWEAWKDYDDNVGCVSFETFVSRRLKFRVIDFFRSKERQFFRGLDRLEGMPSAATFDIPDKFDLLDDLINRFESRTDDDKRQLINILIKDSDSLTTAIVNEYLNDSKANPRKIGRKLGVHHVTVTRRLKKLAKNFDQTKYGNIESYLEVS